MNRIVLTDEDFKDLVHGRVVKKEGVEIALADIGFSRMTQSLREAVTEAFMGHEKQEADKG